MATGLKVSVGADTTEYREEIRSLPREFEKVEQEISASAERVNSSMAKSIGKGLLQGIAAGGIMYKVRALIAEFDQVADSARRFGTTAEDIQRVDVAARQTGSSLESVASAMEAAGVRAAKAAREGGESLEKFDRANIDATAFAAADLATKVEMVAAAQRAAAGDFTALSNITEALGEAVGGVDFDGMAKGMKNVSVLSNDTVKSLSDANTEIEKFQRGITLLIGGGFGMIGRAAQRMTSAIIASADDPFNFTPQGEDSIFAKTRDELAELIKKRDALFELGQKGITNPTDEQIAKQIADALEDQKNAQSKAAMAAEAARAELEKNEATAENQKNIKQRLLEISLQLKEAEAAGNIELTEQLRHSEDIYKGILKYKDAEDAYGMAVREANAELAKRNSLIKSQDSGGLGEILRIRENYRQALTYDPMQSKEDRQAAFREYEALISKHPELKRMDVQAKLAQMQTSAAVQSDPIKQAIASLINGGAAQKALERGAMTEPEIARQQERLSEPMAKSEETKIATETTLQKVANFLEQLNTKLPQPVLV